MKKFLFLSILLSTSIVYGQSPRYGAIFSVSPFFKSPDADTSRSQIGFETKVLGVYNPISFLITYDNGEKILSAMIGFGGGGRDEHGTTTLWGIGPHVDIVNSSEYLTKNQMFVGGGLFFNVNNPEKFEVGIGTSFAVNSKKGNSYKINDQKLNLEVRGVKRITSSFGFGGSAKYQVFSNIWYSKPLWTDILGGRYFPYRRTLQRYTAFIQIDKSNLSFRTGPLFEKVTRDFSDIDGGWDGADTKPRYGLEVSTIIRL